MTSVYYNLILFPQYIVWFCALHLKIQLDISLKFGNILLSGLTNQLFAPSISGKQTGRQELIKETAEIN